MLEKQQEIARKAMLITVLGSNLVLLREYPALIALLGVLLVIMGVVYWAVASKQATQTAQAEESAALKQKQDNELAAAQIEAWLEE